MSLAPINKVSMSAAAGAITVVIVWAAQQFGKVVIPPEVASAITLILMTITGYVTPLEPPA